MGSREIVCRVRALYAYQSNDASSLSFQPNAVIDVLAQLDSGWWDGWCDGKRGWFPSNYVEVIKEVEEEQIIPPPVINPQQQHYYQQQQQQQQHEEEDQMLWEMQQRWQRQQQQPKSVAGATGGAVRGVRDQEMQNQLRLSLHATDMLIPDDRHQPQSDWVIQTTEDGSEQYYYNTTTQEMRYSIPPEGFRFEQEERSLVNSHSHGSLHDTYNLNTPSSTMPLANNTFMEHAPIEFAPPVRPVRAANRSTLQQQQQQQEESIMGGESTFTVNTVQQQQYIQQQQQQEEEEYQDDEDRLPPNWVRKMTPKGRFYYCNIKTDETTWELENIDPDTGILVSSLPLSVVAETNSLQQQQQQELIMDQERQEAAATPTPSTVGAAAAAAAITVAEVPTKTTTKAESFFSDDNMSTTAISWNSLSKLIAQAVHDLKESIHEGRITYFAQDSTAIVQRVRLLLYVSQCLDKETSVHLKGSKQLRTHHRSLLASLAKLVLSTKIASSAWPTPESLAKLESDSDDVLHAVRNFMVSAQEVSIDLKDAKPELTCDNSVLRTSPFTIKNNASVSLLGRSDVVAATVVLADDVRGAMSSFMESVRDAFSNFIEHNDLKGTLIKLKANAPLLVAQFRNLSNTTSHFLNAIEEICQVHQTDQSMILIKSKQPIYTSMGALFVVSQMVTSQHLDAEQVQAAYTRVDQCIHTIESSIQDVIEATEAGYVENAAATVRNTPTPTQRQFNQQRMNNQTDLLDDKDEEAIHQRIDIGLNALMTNPLMDAASIFSIGDDRSDTSSLHSEVTGTSRQPKDTKIAKFFGDDTMSAAAARRRDTITTTNTANVAATMATATSSIMSSNTANNSTTSTFISQGTTTTTTTEMVPWFLQPDIDPNEVIVNTDGNVKGGSLHCLVQHMTQHDQLDSKFNTTFLLTYRSFCTTAELFDELFQRYQLAPPDELSLEELEIWKEKKLKLVRLRVFNIIKSWLETYFNEEEDRPILPEINHFTDHVIVESMKFGAEQLAKLIKKRMMLEDSGQIKKMKVNVRTEDMPVPILPKNMKRIKLVDLDPHELARQMTIMDFKLYCMIKPVECLDKNWGKPDTDAKHIAANVKASIEHSNQVTAWVTDSILSKDELKKRAVAVKHWIFVAEHCRLLNNFNTCMAILSAFDNGSIGRLKRTWELINGRSMQILQNIRRLMGANRNFSEYRDIIHKINPPCIPFLGIYLQDLTFIEDGNSNFLKKSNNLINFAKRMKTAEVIRDLQQYQSTHYMLTVVPDIQEFIKTHLHSSREEEELYNLSLKLEPRERGEDTIARRLKESGL